MNSPPHDPSGQFRAAVFPAELDELKRRRETLGIPTGNLAGDPSVEQGLVGLALSGGGIRSATFSLGVIQGLARQGVLRSVDYLSTVSGGGFIGSCLSSLLNDPRTRPERGAFPLEQIPGAEEPPALTHLRNSSNYLSPGGVLARLRIPNLLLRGILLNFFLFLPYIMAAVLFTEVAYEKGPHWDLLPRAIPPLLLVFLVLAIAFPFVARLLRRYFRWKLRNGYELLLTIPLLLAILIAAAVPFLWLVRLAIESTWDPEKISQLMLALNPLASWDVFLKVTLPVIGVSAIFLLAGKGSQNVSKLRGKILLLAIGLIGPALIFAVYLGLCYWQIDSPFIQDRYGEDLAEAVKCDQPCLDNERFAALRGILASRGILRDPAEIAAARVCVLDPDRVWKPAFGGRDPLPAPVWRIHFRPSASGCNAPGFTIHRVSARSLKIEGAGLELFDGLRDYYFFAIFIGLLLFNYFFLDVNITSVHGFYRDRLSKAYLIKPGQGDPLEFNDEQLLSELNGDGAAGPYHLINVALNLQASKDPSLRGRNADFFFFSKRYVGGQRTGYCPTEAMESHDRHLDLGTAMAISGAAAAPNMGATTVKPLVFILTLLNIRLGYWLPNPARVLAGGWLTRLSLRGAGPSHVWREAMGHLDAKGSHVNVSDGGHIENLGIYPLLKRRCKYIIAVDGEADPNMTFHGLVTLTRYARIDMGIMIDINLDELRKNADGLSQRHWALGTIDYGEGETGHLIYLKSSVTGDENEYVRAYRAGSRRFPHEPTSDQFFSETQFEAYRALGEQIAGEYLTADKLLVKHRHGDDK